MTIPLITGMPGVGSTKTASYRRVFNSMSMEYLPGGKIIDGTLSRDQGNTGNVTTLRAGNVMGKVTSGGKYANSILGATGAAYSSGTSLTVTAVTATELSRRIGASGTFKIVGPPTAAGTVAIETVTYSAISGTTVTVTALTGDFVSGSLILPTDGSEDFKTFIPDGYGVPLLDHTAAAVDQPFPLMPIRGVVTGSNFVNWPSDTALRSWFISQFAVQGETQLTFDGQY